LGVVKVIINFVICYLYTIYLLGVGKYVYANGDEYLGDWVDSKKEGMGKYAYINGDVRDGLWINDLFAGDSISLPAASSPAAAATVAVAAEQQLFARTLLPPPNMDEQWWQSTFTPPPPPPAATITAPFYPPAPPPPDNKLVRATGHNRSAGKAVPTSIATAAVADESIVCVVCMAEPRDGVIVHGTTAHICCCFVCANILKEGGRECPLCRVKIDLVVRSFHA
jgi:hypothetical protein